MPTAGQIINEVGPERGIKIATGLKSLQEIAATSDPKADWAKTQTNLRNTILGINALPESQRVEPYAAARNLMIQKGVIKPEDAPEQYDPAWWTSTLNYGQEAQTPKEKGLERVETVKDGVTGTQFVEPSADAFYPKPTAASPGGANVGSFEDYVIRKHGPNPTAEQITAARKAYMQADDRPPSVNVNVDSGDSDAIAEAIIRGDQPPELTGLYRLAGPVRAALAKKGYNQSTALTDWRATQRHVAALNSTQQTRMAQAIDNAAHSLDVIEDLANQWEGGKFPILNKVQLSAAKNGALGPKAQQIATKLEAQIADVTSELANVYMGGNSPTDHALGLAAKNLSADWTRDQLKAALNLSRKNLVIRQNSMRNVGVAGASAGNPYDQTPSPASAGPTEGATKPIPGFPGTEQTYRGGKWIRTK